MSNHRPPPSLETVQGQAGRHGQTSARESPPCGKERQRQGAVAQTRPAHRTQLRPRSRPRRDAADNPPRAAQSDQAAVGGRADLRPVAALAPSIRTRHAQTMAGFNRGRHFWAHCGARTSKTARDLSDFAHDRCHENISEGTGRLLGCICENRLESKRPVFQQTARELGRRVPSAGP